MRLIFQPDGRTTSQGSTSSSLSKSAGDLEILDDSELTELLAMDPYRVDGVSTAANGSTFLLLKSLG